MENDGRPVIALDGEGLASSAKERCRTFRGLRSLSRTSWRKDEDRGQSSEAVARPAHHRTTANATPARAIPARIANPTRTGSPGASRSRNAVSRRLHLCGALNVVSRARPRQPVFRSTRRTRETSSSPRPGWPLRSRPIACRLLESSVGISRLLCSATRLAG